MKLKVTEAEDNVLDYLCNCNDGAAYLAPVDLGVNSWNALYGMAEKGWIEIDPAVNEDGEQLVELTDAGVWVLAKVRGTLDENYAELVKERVEKYK